MELEPSDNEIKDQFRFGEILLSLDHLRKLAALIADRQEKVDFVTIRRLPFEHYIVIHFKDATFEEHHLEHVDGVTFDAVHNMR